MGFFRSMDISASALTAQRFRMDVIAENIANSNTTRMADGQPYRRRYTVFQTRENSSGSFASQLESERNAVYGGGVRVVSVGTDTSPFKYDYNPSHPDADASGYVRMPNVDTVREMTDMMSATRSYEANVTVLNGFKNIAMKSLEIGK